MTHRHTTYAQLEKLVMYLLDTGEDADELLALVDKYELVSLVMAEEYAIEEVDPAELDKQVQALDRDLWERY